MWPVFKTNFKKNIKENRFEKAYIGIKVHFRVIILLLDN